MTILNVFYGSYDENEGKTTLDTKDKNVSINGSLYVKDANLSLDTGSNLRGIIFSDGNIDIYGSLSTVSQVMIAPKVRVEFFGSVEFYCMIMANKFSSGKKGVQGGSIIFTYVDCTIPQHLNHYHHACDYPYKEPPGPISLHALEKYNTSGNSNHEDGGESSYIDKFEFSKIGSVKEID